MFKKVEKVTKRVKRWNEWRKFSKNPSFYKFLVLLGIEISPTFECYASWREKEELWSELYDGWLKEIEAKGLKGDWK